MVKIVNTVKFSFPSDAARPSWDEIGDFVNTLKVDVSDIDTAYKVTEDKSVCLKFKSERAFKDAVQNNGNSFRFHYANGTSVEVQMLDSSSNCQYVRICELPPEVPDRELLVVLGKYGKVKRVVREKVPSSLGRDWNSGVRGVYMDVEKEIPPALHFLSWRGNVFYEGNKNICFICKQKGHQMNCCPTKKARSNQEKMEEENGQPSTYAGVVCGASSLESNSEVSETSSIERAIEILDKNIVETEEAVDASRNEQQHTKQKNKKLDSKRQLSTESDEPTGGALKKKNTKEQSAADSDGNSFTDSRTVPDVSTASKTGTRSSTRYVVNRGFTVCSYKK